MLRLIIKKAEKLSFLSRNALQIKTKKYKECKTTFDIKSNMEIKIFRK
jgi:hypothetical protein